MNQLPGRIGDSPIAGAGTWADDATCAVSATGGEALIRTAFAHEVDAAMRLAGLDLELAVRAALAHLSVLGESGGCVALAREGAPVLSFTDLASSTNLLWCIHSALLEGGRLVVYESMLNDDRVSPPAAVSLNLTLLATTPAGEVRTASQLREIVDAAGFRRAEFRELPGAPGRVVIAYR